MAFYNNNEFKQGLKVILDGNPCTITEVEFVKPGKGQAFTRVKFRNLRTERVVEKTMKMNETLEAMARALFQSWFVDFDPVRKKAEKTPATGVLEAIP